MDKAEEDFDASTECGKESKRRFEVKYEKLQQENLSLKKVTLVLGQIMFWKFHILTFSNMRL